MNDMGYYLNLPYTIILRRDEQGDIVARIDELPGCAAHGKNPHEALERLEEAKALWITDCLESGDTVPEPAMEEALPSGKWVQRVPRSLHRKLTLMAKREGASLNQLVTSILSEATGRKAAEFPAAKEGAIEVAFASPPESAEHLWHFFDSAYLGSSLQASGVAWRILQQHKSPRYISIQERSESTLQQSDLLRLLGAKIPNRVTDKFEVENYVFQEARARKAKK